MAVCSSALQKQNLCKHVTCTCDVSGFLALASAVSYRKMFVSALV